MKRGWTLCPASFALHDSLESSLDLGRDLICRQTVLTQNIQRLTGLAELIVDTDLQELAADLAHQHIGHGIAQTADGTVLFHSDHIAAGLGILGHAVGVDGFNGMHIDNGDFNALGNKQFGIDFVGNFVVLYYGKFDDSNKRTGDGIHMFFYKNSDLALKSLVYGNFTDDQLNGDFEEYTIVDSEAWREGVVTGRMVDNKYDGEIKMTLTTAKSTTDYVMNFVNGRAEAEGTYVDDDGNTIYVVASAWVGEKQRTYGYPEHFYELEHGLQPGYERAY